MIPDLADLADADSSTTDRRRLPTVWQLAANIWFVLLVTYLVVMPAGLLHIGIPLLGLTGASGVACWLVADRQERLDVRTVILGFAVAGAIPVVLGIVASTPGWRDVAVPLVGGPLLWYFVSHLPDRRGVERLPAALAAGTIGVTVVVMLLLTDVGADVVRYLQPTSYGFASDGEVRINFPGISSLIATVPFLAVLLHDDFRRRRPLGRLVLVGLAGGLVAALLSGRQGVVGTIALTPILMLATSAIGFRRPRPPERDRRRTARFAVGALLVVVLGLGVATQLGLRPAILPRDLLASIGLVEDGNQRVNRARSVRAAQSDSLLTGWREHPALGNGAGAVSPDFYTWRNFDIGDSFTDAPRPWRAELAYHLLLFESGLLGVAGYVGAAFVGVRALARRFRDLDADDQSLCRAAVVAALALAIGTTANPIARAVGHQLMFFLPVLVVAITMRRGAGEVTNPADEQPADDDLVVLSDVADEH